jgi:UDP-GlcNAc:undecaprenyl-phosphate GlcNAc-1-phosphate transferase
VWFLAIPLLDMGVVIVRRVAKRRSPFMAGRDHLHHILLVAGYRAEEVVYIAMGLAIFLGGTAMIVWQAGLPDWVLFYGFMFLLGLGYLVSRRAWRLARLFRRWHKT